VVGATSSEGFLILKCLNRLNSSIHYNGVTVLCGFAITFAKCCLKTSNKKLGYRNGTPQRSLVSGTLMKSYTTVRKSHVRRFAIREWP